MLVLDLTYPWNVPKKEFLENETCIGITLIFSYLVLWLHIKEYHTEDRADIFKVVDTRYSSS